MGMRGGRAGVQGGDLVRAWKAGDRVIVRRRDRSLPRGQGGSIRQADVHGTVSAVDDDGVRVDLDREVNGVRDCYATHHELRREVMAAPLPAKDGLRDR